MLGVVRGGWPARGPRLGSRLGVTRIGMCAVRRARPLFVSQDEEVIVDRGWRLGGDSNGGEGPSPLRQLSWFSLCRCERDATIYIYLSFPRSQRRRTARARSTDCRPHCILCPERRRLICRGRQGLRAGDLDSGADHSATTAAAWERVGATGWQREGAASPAALWRGFLSSRRAHRYGATLSSQPLTSC